MSQTHMLKLVDITLYRWLLWLLSLCSIVIFYPSLCCKTGHTSISPSYFHCFLANFNLFTLSRFFPSSVLFCFSSLFLSTFKISCFSNFASKPPSPIWLVLSPAPPQSPIMLWHHMGKHMLPSPVPLIYKSTSVCQLVKFPISSRKHWDIPIYN